MTEKTFAMQLVEAKNDGKPIERILADTYNKHGNLESAAAELGIHFTTFSVWLKRFNIPIDRKIVSREVL